MTDRTALLAAVLAAPDDDAPRLVYADWLDEHGEHERAEFIRAQCELARLGAAEQAWNAKHNKPRRRKETRAVDGTWKYFPDGPKAWRLHDRAASLFDRWVSGWLPERLGEKVLAVKWHETMAVTFREIKGNYRGPDFEMRFRRGFVDSITCPAGEWLAHADALLAEHPVASVRLTTWPEYVSLRRNQHGAWCRVGDRPKRWVRKREQAKRWRDFPLRGILETEWPGVTFLLPDQVSEQYATLPEGWQLTQLDLPH